MQNACRKKLERLFHICVIERTGHYINLVINTAQHLPYTGFIEQIGLVADNDHVL